MHELQANRRVNQWHPRVQHPVEKQAPYMCSETIIFIQRCKCRLIRSRSRFDCIIIIIICLIIRRVFVERAVLAFMPVSACKCCGMRYIPMTMLVRLCLKRASEHRTFTPTEMHPNTRIRGFWRFCGKRCDLLCNPTPVLIRCYGGFSVCHSALQGGKSTAPSYHRIASTWFIPTQEARFRSETIE
jgi:hypothetical protein